MIFDGLVLVAYISGSIFIFPFTFLRYSSGTDRYGKIMRLVNAVKIMDPRKRTPDSFGMLIQYTGALWMLLGTAYGIIQRRFTLTGILEDGLIFLVFLSPCILLIGAVAFLRRFFWQRQK